MKQYKHKNGESIAEISETLRTCKIINGSWIGYIPAWLVEDSNDWTEIKQEPLFTTDDGVDIFDKGTVLYSVNISSWSATNYKLGSVYPIHRGDSNWKYFSTKEVRLEYISINKPVLLAGEILAIAQAYGMGMPFVKILKEAIEKKLKANDSNL